MEEDIKILEEKIKQFKAYKSNVYDVDFGEMMKRLILNGKEVQTLENLLTRYKETEADNKKYEEIYKTYGVDDFVKRIRKLEKENKEWQRAYQEEKEKQFELLREKDSIPKSLVKEKIEELEKDLERDRICIDFVIEHTKDIELMAEIKVLQELLRGE